MKAVKIIAIAALIAVIAALGTAEAGYFDAHEQRKAAEHQMAEEARK